MTVSSAQYEAKKRVAYDDLDEYSPEEENTGGTKTTKSSLRHRGGQYYHNRRERMSCIWY